MDSTLKSKALLIDSGALNHMMAERDPFSSLETGKSIPIRMGDDSTIISEGQGVVNLEHGYFSNVLYVPSLASNLLSVYQMTHKGVPNIVSFIPYDVEITELCIQKTCSKRPCKPSCKILRVLPFCGRCKGHHIGDSWK